MEDLTKFIIVMSPSTKELFEIENYRRYCHPVMSDDFIEDVGYGAYFVEEEWYNEHFEKYT